MAELRQERQGRVLLLTIDDPATRNALTPEVYRGGREAMALAASDPSIGAVVLTGAGPSFCSGGNLAGIGARRASGEEGIRKGIEELHDFIRAIRETPVPVIAAVEGWAAGAGFSLALACDMMVAAREARFMLAYVKVGLSPDGGATASLARMLPRQILSEIAMEGGPVTAERLYALGLVNEMTETGGALAAAMTRAERLAAGPRDAIGTIKGLISSGQVLSFSDQLDRERDGFARNAVAPDAGEGIKAFLEKRAPRFGGSD